MKKLIKACELVLSIFIVTIISTVTNSINNEGDTVRNTNIANAEVPAPPLPWWGGFGVPLGPSYQPDSGYLSDPSQINYSYYGMAGGEGGGGGGGGGECDGGC